MHLELKYIIFHNLSPNVEMANILKNNQMFKNSKG